MADIFREVDEEVRRDRILRLGRRYGLSIAAVVLLVLVIAVGIVLWRQHHREDRMTEAAAFLDALTERARDPASTAADLADLAEQAEGGYRSLALLQLAAMKAESGTHADAIAAYDAIAADEGADPALRAIACLKAAMLFADLGQAQAARERLAPLLAEDEAATSPWRPLALEIEAVLALEGGDPEGARARLRELSLLAAAPAGLRSRAAELLAALGEPPAASAATVPPPTE